VSLFDLFVDPLTRYGFMRYGLAVAVVVGVTSAVLSCLLVVRRWALLGDAIAHAVLLGVALGWMAGRHVGIFWGALFAGVFAGVAITYVERNSRVKLDAAMGILFTFMFAAGLAIISVIRPRGIDLFHVLLGNILGVGPSELYLTAASGLLVVAVLVVLFKEFHLWSFDPVMAQAVGLPVRTLHYMFVAMLSAAIVASLQAVGLVLVIAMLITPGATAYLLSDRLGVMMWIAAAIGVISATGGLYGSFHVNVASGPAMVIVASLIFGLAFFLAPKRGIVSRAIRRRRTVKRTIEEDILKAALSGDLEAPTTQPEESRTARLIDRGLLSREGSLLRLTEAGNAEAMRLLRAHRLLESYLAGAEGVPISQLHDEAERLEHLVRPEDVEDMDRTLGRPAQDPHGHPIPTAAGELATIAGRTLAEAEAGAKGRVIMVRDDRPDLLREMESLGILPDRQLEVISRSNGAVRIRTQGQDLDVQPALAERIFLRPDA
jgi:manganese transport system permease protein